MNSRQEELLRKEGYEVLPIYNLSYKKLKENRCINIYEKGRKFIAYMEIDDVYINSVSTLKTLTKHFNKANALCKKLNKMYVYWKDLPNE